MNAVKKAEISFRGQIIFNASILILEASLNYAENSTFIVVIMRLAIILCTCLGTVVVRPQEATISDKIIPAIYLVIGFLLAAMYTFIVLHEYIETGQYDGDKDSNYFFYVGTWSLSNSLIFIFICFNTSGMRFTEACYVSVAHTALCLGIPLLLLHDQIQGDSLSPRVFYLPFMCVISMISAHDIEWQVRQGYLQKCELGQSLRRQDQLILSILPEEITIALKHRNLEGLARYFDDVTILFCSIVDFGHQSSSTYAQVWLEPNQSDLILCNV